ncbi:MAG: heavy-metal-associated domain-containing protein [Candidatus Woesebacteria bacterium]
MFNLFSKSKPKVQRSRTLHFKTSGMHCVSCALNIDGALEDVSGVLSSTTSYAKSQTTVEFDENLVDEKKLKEVILKEGYKVTNIVG